VGFIAFGCRSVVGVRRSFPAQRADLPSVSSAISGRCGRQAAVRSARL